MHRVAIIAIVVGVVIGAIGGLLVGAFWIGVGVAVVTMGVTVPCGLAIWKNPVDALKAQAEVEAMASGYPPRTIEPSVQREVGSAQIVGDQTASARTRSRAPDEKAG